MLVSNNVPSRFEFLNDDTLTTILEFVGDKSYRSFGGLNKQCKGIYLNSNVMTKETFLYGYAPLSVIKARFDSSCYLARSAMSKGVVCYNRRDALDWILEENDEEVLKEMCEVAAEEGRTIVLDEVWNYKIVNGIFSRFVFESLEYFAARGGKLNVLKWLEIKELSFDMCNCAELAAFYGHLHILQWLQEEKDLRLYGRLYKKAINGGQLRVMKWLHEQKVPFNIDTFKNAAEKGILNILQWLHDEDCPWPISGYLRVHESWLNPVPEALEWLLTNGYSSRIEYD